MTKIVVMMISALFTLGMPTEPITVLDDSSAKTYMSYETITDETSEQWKLINSDEIQIDERGFLISDDGFIGVALGSYFGDVGEKFIFTLENGQKLKFIKIEEKADCHTCANNVTASDGSVIEFVIDTSSKYMVDNVTANGYIFNGNFNNSEEFEGRIVEIERVIE